MNENFKCQRCGNCCLHHGGALFLTEGEVRKWRKLVVSSNFGRFSAIRFASVFAVGTADIFFHPRTSEELDRCPFLRKLPKKNIYKCLIQDSKPLFCKQYPFEPNGEIRKDATDFCPEAKRILRGTSK